MHMPKSVRVFTADDMCIGEFINGKRRCICQWMMDLFSIGSSYNHKEYKQGCADYGLNRGYTYNDDVGKISEAQAARIMNRITARLGYVMGNPECDSLGRLKPIKPKDKLDENLFK